jgi:hypothetical protein
MPGINSFLRSYQSMSAIFVTSGVYKAAVIAEIRQRGLPAAIEYAQTRGGVGPRCTGLARQMVRLVERCGDVPARVIEASSYPVKPCTMVLIPNLTWTHKGRRQIAQLEWVPVHTFPARVGV